MKFHVVSRTINFRSIQNFISLHRSLVNVQICFPSDFSTVISLLISGLYLHGIFQVSNVSFYRETLIETFIFQFLFLTLITQRTALYMFPSVILDFIGIFVGILFFIINIVATINVFQTKEVDTDAKYRALIAMLCWFMSISMENTVFRVLFNTFFIEF